MESRMKLPHSQGGFALVTVLIVAAVGLLFGAGALLLWRNQCQLRIDRQHELEKVYAVRSALNWVKEYTGEISDEGHVLSYHTGSDRDLNILAKPSLSIFPIETNKLHLITEKEMLNRNFRILDDSWEQYSHYPYPDYEYGSIGATNVNEIIKCRKENSYGLCFGPNVTNNVRWWVNMGMNGTGGWLQGAYGRRYYFKPEDYNNQGGEESSRDIIRLCLIRNVTNEYDAAENKIPIGCRHGWPLSQEGECALVLEVCPKGKVNQKSKEDGGASMTFYEYQFTTGSVVRSDSLISLESHSSLAYMGVQIANDQVTLFYLNMTDLAAKKSLGYTFSESQTLSADTMRYFSEERTIGGIRYSGTNVVDGKLEAPELRAVFEIQSTSDVRTSVDFLTEFRVTNAYQYDIYLEHPASVMNLATVAQKIGIKTYRSNINPTMLTYDTHGTENRGFRTDEKAQQSR